MKIFLYVLGFVVLLWLLYEGPDMIRARKARAAARKAREETAAGSQATPRPIVKVTASPIVADVDDDKPGLHDLEYTRVGLFRPADVTAPMPPVGEEVDLEPEPDNPYDDKAVRAVYDGETVGYMNRKGPRGAVLRAFDQGQIVWAEVTRADDRLEIYIGIDR